MSSATAPTIPIAPLPIPGVEVAAAAAAAAAKLLGATGGNPLLSSTINSQEDQRLRKIYIGNLPREINELVLRNMFEPFGAVESSNVIKDTTGKSQGYGFISFREKDVVEKAIQAMNGMLIGSNIIKVNYVISGGIDQRVQPIPNSLGHTQILNIESIQSNSMIPGADLDRVDDDSGLRINAQNRITLIQKLASSVNIDLPITPSPTILVQLPVQLKIHPVALVHGLLGSASPIPTSCLLLKNMFDFKDLCPNENWESEIYEDVKGEVSKTGSVLHIFVDKNSQGFVYIKMETVDSSIKTFAMLNGRVYGGRHILVEYQFA